MKTSEDLVRCILGNAKIEFHELQEACPELIQEMVSEVKEYSRELVKAALEAAARTTVTHGAYDFSAEEPRDFTDQHKIKNAYPETLIT